MKFRAKCFVHVECDEPLPSPLSDRECEKLTMYSYQASKYAEEAREKMQAFIDAEEAK